MIFQVRANSIKTYINNHNFTDDPIVEEKSIEFSKSSDYNTIKSKIQEASDISEMDGKVMKIRNQDYALIPPTYMLDDQNNCSDFIVDISKISCSCKFWQLDSSKFHFCFIAAITRATAVQDAYLNAIRKNLTNMEGRVSQAERLIPQLQWRRQAHMEQTVNSMATRVAFLNRRIDELIPPQWKSKMPQTMA